MGLRNWRKMTWAIIAWTTLAVLWIAAGASSVSSDPDCVASAGQEACDAATAIGAGLGVSLILFVWFIGFIILSIIWFMTRPRNNVAVVGPDGQKVLVSESEARKRVQRGWTYGH